VAAPPLSVEGVYNQYKGIDGELWPNGGEWDSVPHNEFSLAAEARAHELTAKLKLKSVRPDTCLALCDWAASSDSVSRVPAGFRFVGFDVALETNEYTMFVYSAIFNEILFGYYQELRTLVSKLNENLLFGNLSDAQIFVLRREDMLRAGAGLEDSDEDGVICPVAVYLYD
jgi:hypothetical protein